MAKAQLGTRLKREIDQEVKKSERSLKDAQKAQRKLLAEDRKLHARGKKAKGSEVARIDKQIDKVRRQIEKGERQLVTAEQAHSKVRGHRAGSGKWLVSLSDTDVAKLDKLSSTYKAFARQMSVGLDVAATEKGSICAWSACWTCSEACGGCTGCGQACSQINACIAKDK